MKNSDILNLDTIKKFQNVFDSLIEGIQIIDFNWRFIFVNDTLCKQVNMLNEELIGKNIKEKFYGIDKTPIFKVLTECMTKRKMAHIHNEYFFNEVSSKWFEMIIKPVEEGICIFSLDITQSKLSEIKILKINRLYAFISQVNQNIVKIKNEEELFKNACQIAVEFGKFKIAWIGIFDQQTISLVDQCGILSADTNFFSNKNKQYSQIKVLKTGENFVCNDFLNDSKLKNWTHLIEDYDIKSCIILPIKKEDKIIGTFNLYSSELAFFNQEEIKLLVEVAKDISFAINRFQNERQYKRNEEIIFLNEKRFRALIENSNDVIVLCNTEGKFIYASPSFTKVLGYSVDEYVNLTAFSITHPNNLAPFIETIKQVLSVPGKSIYTQQRLKHKNRKWIWCEGIVTNMMDIKSINAVVINFRDVSEKKRNEVKLLKSEAFSRNVINSLSAHIAVIDTTGKILAVNDAWNRFAIENSETRIHHNGMGSNYFNVCKNSAETGDESAAKVLEGLKNVMTNLKQNFYYEYPCHSPTQERWFAMLAMPFGGDKKSVVIAHQDITDRKIAEEILVQKNKELQKINFELDRFVYSVSHDLRSPLTSVLGLLSFIQEDTKEPDTLFHVMMIYESINRLDEFIKNILNYSRSNRLALQIEKIPLQDTTNKIVQSLIHIKEARNISIEVNIDEQCAFFSDKQSYITVIENLLSNAIKFQDKNKIKQFIKLSGISDEDSLNLEIVDNGIGIAPQDYTKIYDMFHRLSGEVEGSGIGLYIVKEIITKLKGTIDVESILGKETTFQIKLKNLKPC